MSHRRAPPCGGGDVGGGRDVRSRAAGRSPLEPSPARKREGSEQRTVEPSNTWPGHAKPSQAKT
eukprot:8378970-Alexandrium_andersonii.AAC.1